MPAGIDGCISIDEAKEICRIMLRPPQRIVPLVQGTPGVGKSEIFEQLAVEFFEEYAMGKGCPGCEAKDGPSPDPLAHKRGCGGYHDPDYCNICSKHIVEFEEKKGKKVLVFKPYPAHIKLIDVRLSTFDPIETKGLPYTNGNGKNNGEEKTLTKWACPEFLPTDDDVYCILLLDEWLNAPPAVQNASLQYVYDKKAHTHKMGRLVSVACAGNTEGDGSYITRLGGAAKNRVAHLKVEADTKAWIKWARDNSIQSEFIGAVEYRPDTFLPTVFNREADAQSTARTFTATARLMAQQGKYTDRELRRLASPIIGHGATIELIAYIGQYEKVKPEEILFEGKMPEFTPEEVSLKFASCCSVANYIHRHADKMNKKAYVANLWTFLHLLGPELSTKCLGDMHLQEHAQMTVFFLENSDDFFKAAVQEICECLTDTAGA